MPVPVVAPVVVTTPLEEPIVMSADPVLHVPPDGKPLNVVVPPLAHAVKIPVTDVGTAFTVSADTVVQPSVEVYVILVMPAATPVATPDVEPMVAKDGLLLTHVPPVGVLVSDVVAPTHMASVPAIALGNGLTVITFVALHDPDNV